MTLQSYLGNAFVELVVSPDEYPGLVDSNDNRSSRGYSNRGQAPFSDWSGSSNSIRITIKCFSSKNYPNGDNRMFNLTYPHSYKEFHRMVEDKYSYMSPLLILYKDAKGEIVTIDSDFVYKSCLDDAWNQGKIESIPIYIK